MGIIKKIEEFSKWVAITGFRTEKLDDTDELVKDIRRKVRDVHIQFFDASLIAGWEHLYFATLNALKSFKDKMNISKSLSVETLLFASAQRQIKKAVELLGINSSPSQIIILVIADTEKRAKESLEIVSELFPGERDDGVIELSSEKFEYIKTLFGITNLELNSKLINKEHEMQALIDLVIEHVALLAINR